VPTSQGMGRHRDFPGEVPGMLAEERDDAVHFRRDLVQDDLREGGREGWREGGQMRGGKGRLRRVSSVEQDHPQGPPPPPPALSPALPPALTWW
jgi:hypothetical protein